MKFYSILKSALKSIMNNKLRSALTMLGLIIGIASVIIVESLVLSVLGGAIGVVLGLGIGNLAENFDFTFNPNSTIVLISFSSSAIIGLIFGIFPAYRAANLNPIDALRTE